MDAVEKKDPRTRETRQGRLSGTFAWLLLFFLVYCARPEDIFHIHEVPLAKVAGALAIGSFVLVLVARPKLLNVPREMKWLVLLLVWLALGAPFSSVWPKGALLKTLSFAKVVPISLLVATVANNARRLKGLIFVQTASAVLVVLATLSHYDFHSPQTQRLTGVLGNFYGNPNSLAFTLVLVMPFCMMFLLGSKHIIVKLLISIIMIIMGFAILLTYSRGGFLALAISGIVALWQFGWKGKRLGLLFMSSFLAVGLLIAAVPASYSKRVASIVNPSVDAAGDKGSWEARKRLLFRSFEITAEHPLFGVGAGNFVVVSQAWHVTHNTYTELSAEGGVPALILYLMVLWGAWTNLKKADGMSNDRPELQLVRAALLSSFVGFLVGSFFDSVSYDFFPYFLVGYSSALLRIAGEREGSDALIEPAAAHFDKVAEPELGDFWSRRGREFHGTGG